jgi:hypothetical protein
MARLEDSPKTTPGLVDGVRAAQGSRLGCSRIHAHLSIIFFTTIIVRSFSSSCLVVIDGLDERPTTSTLALTAGGGLVAGYL